MLVDTPMVDHSETGKSVAWLNDGIAAVLINVYTLDYQWTQSQIFFFDIYKNGYVSTTTPFVRVSQ